MKKTILSMLVGLSCALSSNAANAEDLLQVYDIATANDPTVLRAKANANAQKYAQDSALGELLPSLNLNFRYSDTDSTGAPLSQNDTTNYQVIDSWSDSFSRTLTLNQTIFNMGIWESLSIAEKRALQSLTQYEQEKQNLIVRIARGYFDVLSELDNLEFVQAEKRAIERQLEQTKQRYEVGLTAITDVHEAQAQFDQSVANEIVTANDVETARETLRTITGKYHSKLNALNTDKFSTVKPNRKSDGFIDIAKEKNLALQVAKASLEIAEDQIDLAQAGHYPTLSLTATHQDSLENSPGREMAPRGDSTNIRLDLNVPIYSGGRTVAATDQARALYVAASEDLEASMRNVTRSVITSYNQVMSNVATYRALEQAVVSAESALQATEAGFEVGTRTIVDVLVSTRNLYSAKRNLANLRYEYIVSTLQLKQASGELSRADLEAINKGLQAAL
ncbi:outer membrane channel protein TolC [Pseudoalteromonas luteoviolacea]|uniref:Outer membrane channel protein n=1 Tax=Pseudoalteromonas luteoviolacea S4054 TaxID=1129367 RepID=A0A0F6AGQ4_9GAMM|nr:outer membrane channel protein TolC [Pseudoalteromonas luteoviolacea]AOT07182.1 outer membrane channel protein TolC [Pseudoalteromonas luteoviolacea]AOT12098.1 outer membrane channel protein TolC [Pseudoalteromonas luteoviolacea]AOT17011.1 outer membrane channel protein TolC [Pseudoalteromonas luteoviolacea]KKE85395.1 outer membrane channel protein [Pseudoalteromonas luteoviolacea S4054]KZN73743.1 outer membrane channel protein [Pseudoalteromonas luteoviolacea S4047-1]